MLGLARRAKPTRQLRMRRKISTIQLTVHRKKRHTYKASVFQIDCFFKPVLMCLGEYKLILLLVGVLSHGKVAKKLADRAIDLMEDVQNLRKAIYPYVNSVCAIDF